LRKNTAETTKARVQSSARPRATGRPATPAADNFTRGSPPGSVRGVIFRTGWRARNSQFDAARRQLGRFPQRLSRSGPAVTHRDGNAASPTPHNGAPPHAGGSTSPHSSPREYVCRVGLFRRLRAPKLPRGAVRRRARCVPAPFGGVDPRQPVSPVKHC
jgi:hypothetical protein